MLQSGYLHNTQHFCAIMTGLHFLPHLPSAWVEGQAGGSSSMLIDWKTLRIPEPVVAEPMLEEWPQPELTGDLALQIADSLRKAASVIDRTSEMGEEEYQGIESQVRIMQTVYDQSQPICCKDGS